MFYFITNKDFLVWLCLLDVEYRLIILIYLCILCDNITVVPHVSMFFGIADEILEILC